MAAYSKTSSPLVLQLKTDEVTLWSLWSSSTYSNPSERRCTIIIGYISQTVLFQCLTV